MLQPHHPEILNNSNIVVMVEENETATATTTEPPHESLLLRDGADGADVVGGEKEDDITSIPPPIVNLTTATTTSTNPQQQQQSTDNHPAMSAPQQQQQQLPGASENTNNSNNNTASDVGINNTNNNEEEDEPPPQQQQQHPPVARSRRRNSFLPYSNSSITQWILYPHKRGGDNNNDDDPIDESNRSSLSKSNNTNHPHHHYYETTIANAGPQEYEYGLHRPQQNRRHSEDTSYTRRRRSTIEFNYSRRDYPVHEWYIQLPFGIQDPIIMNPVVTLASIIAVWTIVIWSAVDSKGALETLLQWRGWISLNFTWFFQLCTASFAFFLTYVCLRYGHITLAPTALSNSMVMRRRSSLSFFGRRRRSSTSNNHRQSTTTTSNHHHRRTHNNNDDDTMNQTHTMSNLNSTIDDMSSTEFSTAYYAVMTFTAGIGAGLFAVSVSQTLYMQQMDNFYTRPGYRSQDEIDMFALNMTITQWGITGWACYTMVSVCMSLAAHCYGLPMTLRSCFYPMLGHYTWGYIGDIIDALAIAATITGVTTSVALGAINIVSGLIYLGWVNQAMATPRYITSIQNATVWIMAVMSTVSVSSGIQGGVRFLSCCGFALSTILLLFILVMEDTKFLLNLLVQEIGYYFQFSTFELHFWTDAFGQLREGSGRAVDDKASADWWADTWIVFNAAWWITWATFVGMFVASISRGRKLWEVIFFGLFAPVGYCIVFFCFMSGAGLRQSRQALELEVVGETFFNDTAHFRSNLRSNCYDVPQENVFVDGALVFQNHLLGITPVCTFDADYAVSAVYNVLYAFQFPETFNGDGLGPMLSVVFILTSVLYMVTKCDSASLVMDNLASTGRKNLHWGRRMVWSLSIGALATALLSSGGAVALRAVQAASILCGLPFAIILCYMMQSIYLLCRNTDTRTRSCTEYQFPDQPVFDMPIYGGVFNLAEFLASCGRVNKARVKLGIDRPTFAQFIEFVKGLLVPFVSLHQILRCTYPENPITNALNVIGYAGCYLGWLILMIMTRWHPGLRGIAWTLFFAAGGMLGLLRSGYRSKYNIRSNAVADLVGGWLFWPQVLTQMRLQRHQQSKTASEHEPSAPPGTSSCEAKEELESVE